MGKIIDDKLRKKRGFVFAQLESDLSVKHGLSRATINDLRELAIHRKFSREEICIRITNALNTGAYTTMSGSPKRHPSKAALLKARTELLHFLLRCPEEVYQDLTKLTKWDWDYEGDDRKMPPKEESYA